MSDEIGLSWKKCILHVHTPASFDYKGNQDITPEEIINKMLEENVDVIAITDHSSVKNIEDYLKANKSLGEPLIIFKKRR